MREPAWHALGTVVTDDISVLDAIEMGGIDFQYHKIPVGYSLPNGRFVEVKDQFMVVREPVIDDPDWRDLGIVGKDYTFLQNTELAEGLDKLAKETGWKFETVGALGHGETVFMTLKIGDRDIKGDKFDNYVIVSDGKVANRALSIAIAPIRVVCQNTLMASDNAANFKVKVNHSRYIRSQYDFWTDNLGEIERAQNAVFDSMDQMASVKISEADADQIFAVSYPMPEKRNQLIAKERLAAELERGSALLDEIEKENARHEVHVKRTEARREASMQLYREFNAGNEYGLRTGRSTMATKTLTEIRETPYAALQAVTELVDWGGARDGANAAMNSLFGSGAGIKQRAYAEALKVARS
jgi:phage/plasmid-like protein (TIGR03299 family)